LSTPPAAAPTIAAGLGAAGLSRPDRPEAWSRLVVEKPFGSDLPSARVLNAALHAHFAESQIYRIDHYLGKETVQNILILRFANRLFEPAWNRENIDHVQITAAETLGVEHRAGYYDAAGVVRDMFQNHLLQLLSLVAIEPPTRFDADAVRGKKAELVQAIRPIDPGALAARGVRAQYAAGTSEGAPVPAYAAEEGVPPSSTTPTYAALRLEIDNWRWQGVPFYLRAGKRMAERVSEIAVSFKHVPVSIFKPLMADQLSPNVLRLRIQPDESVSLSFEAKHPGPKLCLSTVTMDFDYHKTFGTPPPESYARLIADALCGDQTLFARADEIEASWSLLAPVLEAWSSGDGLDSYAAGSWGPAAADELLAREGRRWLLP
ncbi:MAG TPA: glucose-6-phosphate dehydrogenase, partial [Elusimicrobiota bacterium]|nr:glucose-6-phosphate dehydrogenase [Elusimicrobiota bacterium]